MNEEPKARSSINLDELERQLREASRNQPSGLRILKNSSLNGRSTGPPITLLLRKRDPISVRGQVGSRKLRRSISTLRAKRPRLFPRMNEPDRFLLHF